MITVHKNPYLTCASSTKEKVSEYFTIITAIGFYNIFGKFAAIMGPSLLALVTQITGKSNYGVLSIIVLFIIGGIILTRVPDESN
ncbi:hypothetical protein [Dethiothermospora halolimnae]|uniref:hypothetical protein n=1 Tax=Dethiothermospora halolimnae TaxID=3114390 RepID=UPI003CCC1B7D